MTYNCQLRFTTFTQVIVLPGKTGSSLPKHNNLMKTEKVLKIMFYLKLSTYCKTEYLHSM